MADQTKPPKDARPHLDAIKGHLEKLRTILPQESIANLSVQLTQDQQMLICYPDPNNPGKVICV